MSGAGAAGPAGASATATSAPTTAPGHDALCRFVSGTTARALDAPRLDATLKCLVDWFAVSLAARPDAGPTLVRRQMLAWATRGQALSLYGDSGAAAPTALVNATLSHSLDFDDMHFGSAFHASGPTLAAALAVGMDRGASEHEILGGFLAGFEVGTLLGDGGTGPRLAAAGWHPTGVLGHLSAAAAAAALLKLTPGQTAHALGLAATQVAGLQASGGTMAKPFHVGKAAMNGVMAAELAAAGLDATTRLLSEGAGSLMATLFQDRFAPDFESLGRTWRIDGNTFKPYAACQLTHAAYEAARRLAGTSLEGLGQVVVTVNPLAPQVASRPRATTPLEGKFCIPYCVALGLEGHDAGIGGFTPGRVADARVQAVAAQVRVETSDAFERSAARVELRFGDGRVVAGVTEAVLGSPSRPLEWRDLEAKFIAATEPELGARAEPLLHALRSFAEPGRLGEVRGLLAAP